MTVRPHPHAYRHLLTAVILAASVATASAQTRITPDRNTYSPADDVRIGREAAQEVRRELPLLNDDRVDDYVDDIGRDLVRAIPPQFQHPEFSYSFDVINQAEINAFALPGGPMFLNRGMIEKAQHEGEVAGVMAHEIAHVALRHGTAQATKGQKFQIGAIAGQILGAIVGGTAGSIIAQGSNFGLSAYFLKYGREYEREADLLGAQIMARAGYDPRHMANMFRTIEQQGRTSGGPEWLSSHPNPGNRQQAILQEAEQLRVQGRRADNGEFREIQARLDRLSPAWTAEQIARARAGGRPTPSGAGRDEYPRAGNVRVAPPSNRYEVATLGDWLRLRIPSNWRQAGGGNSVTFAPEGAFYRGPQGNTGFTHGLQLGVIPNESHNHQEATEELIDSLSRSNPRIRRQTRGYVRESISGRTALTTTLRNVSEVTGATEMVYVTTVPLRNGSLLYMIAVTPADQVNEYQSAFRRIKQSTDIRDQALVSRR